VSPCHFPTQSSYSTGLVIVKVKFTVLRINETSENMLLVIRVGQKMQEIGCVVLFDTSGQVVVKIRKLRNTVFSSCGESLVFHWINSQELCRLHQQCFLASYVPTEVARVTSCHRPRAVLSTMSPQKGTENRSTSITGSWGCISTWFPLYTYLAQIQILFLGPLLGSNENVILLMCLLWCYYGHVMSHVAICWLITEAWFWS